MERPKAFRDLEASIADLNYLSLSLSYINEHENEFMDYLHRVKNLEKNQVFEEFIRVIGYISSTVNIRLRSSVEEYVKSKGYTNKILEQWVQKTPEYKIEYFPDSEKIGNVPQTVTFINTRSNNLFHGRSKFKRADMFESGLSGLPKEEHG